MTDVKIEIQTMPKVSLVRVVTLPLMQVAVIGVGIAVDSAAMQWSGFVFLCLLVLMLAVYFAAKNTGLTFAQARARIDELEAENQLGGTP